MSDREDKRVDRRRFFSEGLKRLRAGAAELASGMIEKRIRRRYIRPPGAGSELAFLSRCTKCDDCVIACPHYAIFHLPGSAGVAAHTPGIDPAKSPCLLCDDLPCIAACTTGALTATLREDVKIADISLKRSLCLPWQGTSPCDYCFKWCPLRGQAITLDDERPVFHNEACTGCGICLKECPADPNPIRLTPV